MKLLNYFTFAVIFLQAVTALATKNFISIHALELDQKIKSKTELAIFDANLDSTRKFVGIIEGARLLSSASEYDTTTELPKNKKTPLVFYCANNLCTASHTAAKRALAAGYQNVSVMVDGIYGWKKAGYPLSKISTTAGERKASTTPASMTPNEVRALLPQEALDLATKKEAVIVDVRENEERHQVVKGSLWFPMSKITDENEWIAFRTQLPQNKMVIFHCAAGVRAKKIATLLAKEGSKTAFFEGPDQWEKAGLPLEKGPAL